MIFRAVVGNEIEVLKVWKKNNREKERKETKYLNDFHFWFCFVLWTLFLFCFVLFCFVLFVLFCFVLFCFVLFFVLFCVLFLFCFVLFCFVLFGLFLFFYFTFFFLRFCFVNLRIFCVLMLKKFCFGKYFVREYIYIDFFCFCFCSVCHIFLFVVSRCFIFQCLFSFYCLFVFLVLSLFLTHFFSLFLFSFFYCFVFFFVFLRFWHFFFSPFCFVSFRTFMSEELTSTCMSRLQETLRFTLLVPSECVTWPSFWWKEEPWSTSTTWRERLKTNLPKETVLIWFLSVFVCLFLGLKKIFQRITSIWF